ncbi:MAG: hypothetical protein ACE5JQ_00825 [Candidatus Methylomirabilales bacterium]
MVLDHVSPPEGEEAPGPPAKPFLTPSGILVIPFEADSRYHWWAGGQSIAETLRELEAPAEVVNRYSPSLPRPSGEPTPIQDG